LVEQQEIHVQGLTHRRQDREEEIMLLPNQASEAHLFTNINRLTIVGFQIQLNYENWENVFSEKEVNSSFNNFLNTYLRLFNSSFSKKKLINKQTICGNPQ
jgi:hypothetical protein